jgi:hypothetical protein
MKKETGFRVLKRDFIDQQCCAFCNHALPSGIGFVVLHPRMGQQAAGEACARRVGRASDFPVPDLTRGVEAGYLTLRKDRQTVPADIPSAQRALEYTLMCSGFKPDESYHPVQAVLTAWRHDAVLTPELIQPILSGIDAGRAFPRTSEKTITHAYAAKSMLDRCLESGRMSADSQAFLALLRDQLLEKHWLSPKQVQAINKKLAIVAPGAPRLDPSGFQREPYPLPLKRRPREIGIVA